MAGAGKTTALDAVRDAYEAAGYRVIGTATSGQAARTLGREAGIASRTPRLAARGASTTAALTLDAAPW